MAKQTSKLGTIKDAKFYTKWNEAHDYCMVCGLHKVHIPFPGISTHHLCKFRRSDEATNLLRLCNNCHCVAEHATIKDQFGLTMPKLSFANLLWMKHKLEPGVYNPERLAILYGRPLPDEQAPDLYYLKLFTANRPWDYYLIAEGFDAKSAN